MNSRWPWGARAAVALLLCAGLLRCGACPEQKPTAPALPSEPVAATPVDATPLDAGLPGPPIAHLEFTHGEVILERGGNRAAAQLGYLYWKDALETGDASEARLRIEDGHLIEVGPGARLVLNKDSSGVLLEVVRGLVLTRVPKQPGARRPSVALSVLTPYGLTRLGSGENEVSLDVGADKAKLQVLMGQVELLSREGEASKAGAGEQVALSLGRVQLLKADEEPVLDGQGPKLVSAGGRAEVRQKGNARWKQVSRRGLELFQGDEARVLEGQAMLELPGSPSTLTFLQETELLFGGAVRLQGAAQAELTLKRGRVLASLAQGRPSRLLLGGLELQSDQGGNFLAVKIPDGFEIKARTGDALLRKEGKEHLLRAGQVVRWTSAGIDVTKLPREPVAVPTRSNIKIFHSGMGELTIDWDPAGHEDFRIVVASDPSLSNVVLAGVVHEPRLNVPAPQSGTLYWKVTTLDGKDLDRGSATFAPEPAQDELTRARNEVPEGSQTTTIYFQDKPPAVTFTYATEPNAVRYRVRVYFEDDLERTVAELTVDDGAAPLGAGVLGEGIYRWSVTPISESGEELRGGNMSRLELVYDNALPGLVIKSPKNGESHAGGPVPVAGIAPVGSKLLVNGETLALDDKGRFEAFVAPAGQPPRLVFNVTLPGGAQAYTVRTLRRAR